MLRLISFQAVPVRPSRKGKQGQGKVEHLDLKGDERWVVSLWCT
jgi:hypothetical protein